MEHFKPIAISAFVNEALESDGLGFLIDFLQAHNACIAGSYVAAVHDEHRDWNPSDVDIWAPDEIDVDAAISAMAQHDYTVSKITNISQNRARILNSVDLSNKSNEYIKCINDMKEEVALPPSPPSVPDAAAADVANDDVSGYDSIPRFRRSIRHIVSFGRNRECLPIQLIVCKTPTVFDAVMLFDLDVCRILYDGKTVYSAQGPVPRTVAITKECLAVQTVNEWCRTIKRCAKYISRGYTIDWTNAIEHMQTNFSQNGARDWNNAVLHTIHRIDRDNVYVLKTTAVPYWTRRGTSVNSSVADLVLGGNVLASAILKRCELCNTAPAIGKFKIDSGNIDLMIVLKMMKFACGKCAFPHVVQHDPYCSMASALNRFDTLNFLPVKFELPLDRNEAVACYSNAAEFNEFVRAVRTHPGALDKDLSLDWYIRHISKPWQQQQQQQHGGDDESRSLVQDI